MSPSEAAFMYDREGSRNQRGIGVFLQTEKNIAEEDEEEVKEVIINTLYKDFLYKILHISFRVIYQSLRK